MSDRQFEAMFSYDGWIVGWVLQRDGGHTRIDQDPQIRVTLGALLQVRSDANDMLAVVRIDPHDKHWTQQMRAIVDPLPRCGGGGGGGSAPTTTAGATRCSVCNSHLVYPTPVLSVPPYCPVCTHD